MIPRRNVTIVRLAYANRDSKPAPARSGAGAKADAASSTTEVVDTENALFFATKLMAKSFPVESVSALRPTSKSQIVIHSNGHLLLGTEIAFSCLYRGVAEQEYDLLQISAVLPAELGVGATEVVGAELFYADMPR
jgi:hypothetical protein